jgi:hypothetical protein
MKSYLWQDTLCNGRCGKEQRTIGKLEALGKVDGGVKPWLQLADANLQDITAESVAAAQHNQVVAPLSCLNGDKTSLHLRRPQEYMQARRDQATSRWRVHAFNS